MTSPENIIMRELSSDDGQLMNSLLSVFAEAFEDAKSYNGNRPSPDYQRKLLGDSNFIVLVAQKDNEVIGGIAAYVLHKFEQERSEIYIYDLAVSHSHRRQGIAEALIVELKEIAKKRGIYVIFVQADDGDDPAVALYSKFTKREEVAHFDIDVDLND